MIYENDFCLIKSDNDEFVFERKRKRREKNVLGDIVEDLIDKYSDGKGVFKYVETLGSFIDNLESYDNKTGATYDMLENFINNIVSQHYMLGDYKKTIYCANFENILVFDNEFFIFMGNDNKSLDKKQNAQGIGIDDIGLGIVDFNLKGNCLITDQMLSILKHTDSFILPPEINDLLEGAGSGEEGSIMTVSKHLFNYNLGIILFSFLFNNNFLKQNNKSSYNSLIEKMQSIFNTKAFYLIQRCIDDKPYMRALLYV